MRLVPISSLIDWVRGASSLVSRSLTADGPNRLRGTETVVRGGSTSLQIGRSSNPMMDMFSGTEKP